MKPKTLKEIADEFISEYQIKQGINVNGFLNFLIPRFEKLLDSLPGEDHDLSKIDIESPDYLRFLGKNEMKKIFRERIRAAKGEETK